VIPDDLETRAEELAEALGDVDKLAEIPWRKRVVAFRIFYGPILDVAMSSIPIVEAMERDFRTVCYVMGLMPKSDSQLQVVEIGLGMWRVSQYGWGEMR
jgi:hypothetical protein